MEICLSDKHIDQNERKKIDNFVKDHDIAESA